ncbi:MAG TPA: proline dehydrogenase family protein, partial [Methyloceanibacter sp.]|nr:proline dehydrogenase family protein [Methyloceanibacter sp.]
MGEPRIDIAATTPLPSREAIGGALLADEDALVEALIDKARFSDDERQRIEAVATGLVEAARAGRHEGGGVDSFLAEYGLSSEEGVLLLCLAEALLRIPDAATADRLIAGTVGLGDWAGHLGHSESVLVNASTWGLMLTGHMVDWGEDGGTDLGARVQRLIARSGEPVIREAMRRAMRILGNQFVLGETIEAALDNAAYDRSQGYRFSFDMLGEAARTAEDADRYAARYADAATAIAAWAGSPESRTEEALHTRPGLSVKLSALHPSYVPSQEARLRAELVPRLTSLARTMREAWLPLTIDAEEAERLDLSLSLLEPLFTDPDLAGWNGLGLAVQAYSKRALKLIDWLAGVAEATGRRIPVRL